MVNVKYAGLNIILTENSFSIMSFFFYMEKVSFAKSYIKIFFKDFTANNIFFVYMLSCDKIILIAKEKKEDGLTKKRKKTNKQTRNKNNFSA